MNKKRMVIILSTLLLLLLIGSITAIFLMNQRKNEKQNNLSAKAESNIKTGFELNSDGNVKVSAEASTNIQNETPDTTTPITGVEPITETVTTVATETVTAEANDPLPTNTDNEPPASSIQSKTDSNKERSTQSSKSLATDPAAKAKTNDTPTTTPTDSKPRTDSDSIEHATEVKTEVPQVQTTEVPTRTEKTTSPKQEDKAECNHTWVWATKTETIHHDAVIKEGYWHVIAEAYEKPISVEKIKCGHCKNLYDDYDDYRLHDDCHGSYGWVTVDSGKTVHVDEEKEWIEPETIQEAYDETITVNDYQYCSKCNKRR